MPLPNFPRAPRRDDLETVSDAHHCKELLSRQSARAQRLKRLIACCQLESHRPADARGAIIRLLLPQRLGLREPLAAIEAFALVEINLDSLLLRCAQSETPRADQTRPAIRFTNSPDLVVAKT